MGKLSKPIQKFLANPLEVRFKKIRTLLEDLGFYELRAKGSHYIF
jgi:predicted RNA binding protein YcfA (HicA-like mRNA interferase family)